jgi:iron(III) transport system permease protein
VRAITSVSAVIFLVSADHNMATSYIIGLVENGEFGIAIAYCSVLILVMLTAIIAINLFVGERRLRRTTSISHSTKSSSLSRPSLKEKQA